MVVVVVPGEVAPSEAAAARSTRLRSTRMLPSWLTCPLIHAPYPCCNEKINWNGNLESAFDSVPGTRDFGAGVVFWGQQTESRQQ